MPEDLRVSPFDSLFEQRVFNRLVDRGYTVIPQYDVEGYRIDLVILGAKTKVAIECDGDAWHGADRYEADLARKRDLERCGWTFFNLAESLFYVDRAAALAPLWTMLADLGVHPSGWEPPAEGSSEHPKLDPEPPIDEVATIPSRTSPRLAPSRRGTAPPDPARAHDQEVLQPAAADEGATQPSSEEIFEPIDDAVLPERSRDDIAGVVVAPTAPRALTPAPSTARLARYDEFDGVASAALAATQAQLIEELLAIVEVEGPLLGERLHQAHVKAAGGQRVGRMIAHALNSAITAAKRRGVLVEDDPLSESGVKPRTYRLPNQPLSRMRELGPRTLEQVPPREVASVMRDAADVVGWTDEQALFREVLDSYGLRRLTPNAVARLQRVRALAEADTTL